MLEPFQGSQQNLPLCPRVVSTLGYQHSRSTNAESVRLYSNPFRVHNKTYHFVPGLKQPWAGIGERLRRRWWIDSLTRRLALYFTTRRKVVGQGGEIE